MDNDDSGAATGGSREERLAAKLRENLKRRKMQARAVSASEDPGSRMAAGDREALPKAPGKS